MPQALTVKDLEKATGLSGKVIRRHLRAQLKSRAPYVEGIGKRWRFDANDPGLAKALGHLKKVVENRKAVKAPAA